MRHPLRAAVLVASLAVAAPVLAQAQVEPQAGVGVSEAAQLTPQQFIDRLATINAKKVQIGRQAMDDTALPESAQQLGRQIGERGSEQLARLRDTAEQAQLTVPGQDLSELAKAISDERIATEAEDPGLAFAQKVSALLNMEMDVYRRADQLGDATLRRHAEQARSQTQDHLRAARAVIDAQALARTPEPGTPPAQQ